MASKRILKKNYEPKIELRQKKISNPHELNFILKDNEIRKY